MIRKLQHRLEELKELQSRKAIVIQQIEKAHPEALRTENPHLRKQIELAKSLEEVEDLYLPYKPKKAGTLAERARALGPALERLADTLWVGRMEKSRSDANVVTFPSLLKPVMEEVGKVRSSWHMLVIHFILFILDNVVVV
jgi:transcriptional accessory protein Tex/SPT6